MLTLALETSGKLGAAAILDENRVMGEAELSADQRTAECLVPVIRDLLHQHDLSVSDLNLIAVTEGPGSFTGLRIGVTLAKTLAYATGAAIIGVNTLEVIAAQTLEEHQRCCCLIDAHRQQLFTAHFRRGIDVRPVECQATRIEPIDDCLAALGDAVVAGPVLSKLEERLPTGCTISSASHWNPRAATVGRLARHQMLSGQPDDFWTLVPQYYRASAAEEKAAK